MFSKIVSAILEQLKQDRKKIDMVIYSETEKRQIGEIIYPLQIYHLTQFSEWDWDPFSANLIRDNPLRFIEEYNKDEYIISNHLDVFCEAKMLENQKCWTNGRIWVTTDSITPDHPIDERKWKKLLDPRSYPYEVQERIRNPFKSLKYSH